MLTFIFQLEYFLLLLSRWHGLMFFSWITFCLWDKSAIILLNFICINFVSQAIYILEDKSYKLKHRVANGSLTGKEEWNCDTFVLPVMLVVLKICWFCQFGNFGNLNDKLYGKCFSFLVYSISSSYTLKTMQRCRLCLCFKIICYKQTNSSLLLLLLLNVGISVSSKTDGVFVLHLPIEGKGDKVCFLCYSKIPKGISSSAKNESRCLQIFFSQFERHAVLMFWSVLLN